MRYIKGLTLTILVVAIAGMVVLANTNIAMAKVGSKVEVVCSVCHTMHHSQDGENPPISFDTTRDTSTGPNDALLFGYKDPNADNSSCVACHAGSSDEVDGYDPVTGAPQIDLTGDDILAGGTYFGDTDAVRHNALLLAENADDALGNVPPGGSETDIDSVEQITCAGTSGCHGDRSKTDNLEAVYGAHHGDDAPPLDGFTVGKSYRFLSTNKVNNTDGPYKGVLGMEHSNWESGMKDQLSSTTAHDPNDHNVYDAEGINKLCGSCHGNFHGDAGQGGPNEPWLRHPTDISLAAAAASGPSDEYGYYPNDPNDPSSTRSKYSTQAPVGYATDDIGEQVDYKQGKVLCVSCHRAHGAETWNDILRWDYNEMKAGGEKRDGCIRCHTKK